MVQSTLATDIALFPGKYEVVTHHPNIEAFLQYISRDLHFYSLSYLVNNNLQSPLGLNYTSKHFFIPTITIFGHNTFGQWIRLEYVKVLLMSKWKYVENVFYMDTYYATINIQRIYNLFTCVNEEEM